MAVGGVVSFCTDLTMDLIGSSLFGGVSEFFEHLLLKRGLKVARGAHLRVEGFEFGAYSFLAWYRGSR